MSFDNEVGAQSYKNTGRSNAAWVRVKKWFAGLRPALEGYGDSIKTKKLQHIGHALGPVSRGLRPGKALQGPPHHMLP